MVKSSIRIQYMIVLSSLFGMANVTASEHPVVQQKTVTQKKQESAYCPELQCWTQAPCFQHTRNAQVRWHDAQRWLTRPLLLLVGSYAWEEHTHTISRIMPAIMLTESNILPHCPSKLAQHFTLDDSETTNIKKIWTTDSTSIIASILLSDSSKKLFRRGQRPDEADYVPYRKSPTDDSLVIEVSGRGSGIRNSTIHLVPADNSALVQAGFLK